VLTPVRSEHAQLDLGEVLILVEANQGDIGFRHDPCAVTHYPRGQVDKVGQMAQGGGELRRDDRRVVGLPFVELGVSERGEVPEERVGGSPCVIRFEVQAGG